MRTTLRTLEGMLTARGHRTARHNAWTAVLEDRRRAEARTEAELLLQAQLSGVRPGRPHLKAAGSAGRSAT